MKINFIGKTTNRSAMAESQGSPKMESKRSHSLRIREKQVRTVKKKKRAVAEVTRSECSIEEKVLCVPEEGSPSASHASSLDLDDQDQLQFLYQQIFDELSQLLNCLKPL